MIKCRLLLIKNKKPIKSLFFGTESINQIKDRILY